MPTNELVKGFTINDEQHLIDVSSLDGETTETVLFDGTIDCQDQYDAYDLDGNTLYGGYFDGETPIDAFQLSYGDCVKIYIDGNPYISYCIIYDGNTYNNNNSNDGSGYYLFQLGNQVYCEFGWFVEDDDTYNFCALAHVTQGIHTLKISKINQSRLSPNLVPKSLNYGNEQEVILESRVEYF